MVNKLNASKQANGYRAFFQENNLQAINLTENERFALTFFKYPVDILEKWVFEKDSCVTKDVLLTLGLSYYFGLFIPKNNEKAFQCFDIAANNFDSEFASLMCANFLLLGIGINQNMARAVKIYRSIKKNSAAKYNLAYCIELGLGTKKSLIDAFKVYEQLGECENLFALPEYRLANCYYYGLGVKRNKYAALVHYEMATKLGSYNALIMFGHMRYFGIECMSNVNEAFGCFNDFEENDKGINFYGVLDVNDVSFGNLLDNPVQSISGINSNESINLWCSLLLCNEYLNKGDYSNAEKYFSSLIENGFCEATYVYNRLKGSGIYKCSDGSHLISFSKTAYTYHHLGSMQYLSDRYFEALASNEISYNNTAKNDLEQRSIDFLRDCTLLAYNAVSNNISSNKFTSFTYEYACILYFAFATPPNKTVARVHFSELLNYNYKNDIISALLVWDSLINKSELTFNENADKYNELIKASALSTSYDCIKILYVTFAIRYNCVISELRDVNLVQNIADTIENRRLRNFFKAEYLLSLKKTREQINEIVKLYTESFDEKGIVFLENIAVDYCDRAILNAFIEYLAVPAYVDGLCCLKLGELYYEGLQQLDNASMYFRLAIDNNSFPFKQRAVYGLFRVLCTRKAKHKKHLLNRENIGDNLTDSDKRILSGNDDQYEIIGFYLESWYDKAKMHLFNELLNGDNQTALRLNGLGNVDDSTLCIDNNDNTYRDRIFYDLPNEHYQTFLFAAQDNIFEYANCLEQGIGIKADIKRAKGYYKKLQQTDKRAGLRLANIYIDENKITGATEILYNYIAGDIPEAYFALADLAKVKNVVNITDNEIRRLQLRGMMLLNSYSFANISFG